MRIWLLLAGLAISTAGNAQANLQERLKAQQADPAATRAAIEAGQKAAFFCVNCHGEQGVSKTPEVPNLAGQNPAYLLEQIRKFGSGERVDPFMQGLIKVLKDEDRLQIAQYYASLPVPASPAESAQVAQGKMLFAKLCVRCHGEQARGSALFPRLAGQKAAYLKTTITRYRDFTGVRNNQQMTIATSLLKNEDIAAIAGYLAQLP